MGVQAWRLNELPGKENIMMNGRRGFNFIDGIVLGALIGAAVAVLTSPAVGAETRNPLRAGGASLKPRGQEIGNDRLKTALK